jgi:hypothetical protein
MRVAQRTCGRRFGEQKGSTAVSGDAFAVAEGAGSGRVPGVGGLEGKSSVDGLWVGASQPDLIEGFCWPNATEARITLGTTPRGHDRRAGSSRGLRCESGLIPVVGRISRVAGAVTNHESRAWAAGAPGLDFAVFRSQSGGPSHTAALLLLL